MFHGRAGSGVFPLCQFDVESVNLARVEFLVIDWVLLMRLPIISALRSTTAMVRLFTS